jgi:glycosyltransferase involved in cell wall biosynthesis
MEAPADSDPEPRRVRDIGGFACLPDLMASAIQRLFDASAERRRIGHNARLAVEQRYGWPAITREQSVLYRSLLHPRKW